MEDIEYMRSKIGIGKLKDDVETPKDLYDLLNSEFKFTFDPCPLECTWNALLAEFAWGDVNFVNPPFSNIEAFLRKGVLETMRGKTSVFLVPVRSGSKYWHDFVYPYATEIRFLQAGIKFKGYDNPSPFAACILVFKPNTRNTTNRNQKQGDKTYRWYSVNLEKQ